MTVCVKLLRGSSDFEKYSVGIISSLHTSEFVKWFTTWVISFDPHDNPGTDAGHMMMMLSTDFTDEASENTQLGRWPPQASHSWVWGSAHPTTPCNLLIQWDAHLSLKSVKFLLIGFTLLNNNVMGVRGVYVSRGWEQEPTRLTSVPPLWLAQCLRDVCGVQ